VLLLFVFGGCSKRSPSFRELKAEHALADSLVHGYTPSDPESLAKVVTLAREKTKKFLVNHKDDVPAAILFVKLRLAEEALTPHPSPPPDSTGAPPDHFTRAAQSKTRIVDCLQALDHAITVEPKNADLYYWKSLVHGLWEPIFEKQSLDPRRSQLPQAVAAATKAVALAPDSANYRTALASYQMLTGDDAAALKTLRAGKDSTNATLLILQDWEKFPLPPGAVYSPRESAGIAEWMAASGLDDSNARVRAYWIPGSQDAIRAFYESKWNGLYWMSQKQAQKNGEQWAFGSAAVMIEGNGYRAVKQSDLKNAAMTRAQGISIQIREVRNMQAKGREAVPFDAGKVVCELLVTNHRRAR
jgi:hypothetical protein